MIRWRLDLKCHNNNNNYYYYYYYNNYYNYYNYYNYNNHNNYNYNSTLRCLQLLVGPLVHSLCDPSFTATNLL